MKKTIEQAFSVPFTYPVCFTENIFDSNNGTLAKLLNNGKKAKAYFVVDEGVLESHPNLLKQIKAYSESYSGDFTLCAEPLVVPGGEKAKNDPQHFQTILEATSTYGIDRHSYIVAIGGGAVIDMAGFASAIAHRGIRHIRIPTTVLAQNDAAIGVKNGVNVFGKKNYMGTFAPPYAVINDSAFLTTLSDRDWRSGISEAIKVALIKDPDFYEWIEAHAALLVDRDMATMEELIYRCAALHLDHIAGKDPFEFGSSRPLDFGHWAAHKLEHLTQFGVRHGEAVAIGIALDATYSWLKGLLSEDHLKRIVQLIKALGFDLYVPELSGEALLKGLEEFREHLGGELTIMLLEGIGKGIEVHEMDGELILQSVEKLKSFTEENIAV
ncbi:MAG TPA: 3-dehydroquinate synthase [Cyclobacteriaceae bacterium]|nr:3-dehydroquinate synthase [Cyclobacteriaceae bacterium]